MSLKYKSYWRKTGLKGRWGEVFLNHLNKHKPKKVMEIGVFCGVTAKNICDFLDKTHKGNYSYIGIDLFGEEKKNEDDEIEPEFLKNNKFSNPLKNLYYNIILKENLNSIESVRKFLNKYKDNINLIKGDTNIVLKTLNLSDVDYVFHDGGHSYNTVFNDLTTIFKILKGQQKIFLCDDYGAESYIPDVKNAIDDFALTNKLKVKLIENRFAEIIT